MDCTEKMITSNFEIVEKDYIFTPPNWRNQDEYPTDKGDHTLSFWAWQFLRRNKDYQNDWLVYAETLVSIATQKPEVLPYIRIDLNLGRTIRNDEMFRLSKLVNEVSSTYQLSKQCISLGKKWGLLKIHNPTRADITGGINHFLESGTQLIHFEFPERDTALPREFLKETHPKNGDEYVRPVFDLRFPVEVLRSQFELILKKRQARIESEIIVPHKGRPHKQVVNFQNYLRVLDALDEGRSIPEIAEIILSKQDQDNAKKTVRNWKNAATLIRDKDYITLPLYCGFRKKS